MKEEEKEEKEKFCVQCMAIPLAMIGTAGANSFSKNGLNFRKSKYYILLISLGLTLFSLFVGFYYFCVKQDCNQCKGP
jgi:hypothetical protein